MEPAKWAIRDFLKAVDNGWLGKMPEGFDDSAFVKALRAQAAELHAIERDLREQASGSQDGYLLDVADRLRKILDDQ